MAEIKYSDLVDYSKLDPVKKQAMEMFASTLEHPERMRMRVMPTGESGVALDLLDYDFMLGFNVEGLGTKNRVADAMYAEAKARNDPEPERFYEPTGQDTVACSVMDLVSGGADPIFYGDFLTAGNSNWFADEKRNRALLKGYKTAADMGGFAIPCGETPALPDVVNPDTLVLEGASVGIIRPKSRLSYGQKIEEGDLIYGLPSNGAAANGISKLRRIAAKLPEGFFTKMPDGKTFGEAILVPTPIYVRPIIEMFDEADLHYVSPITGHGWSKVGRAKRPFKYIIDNLPKVPEVFWFAIDKGASLGFDISDKENYYVWNMGVTPALIAPAESESKMRGIAEKYGTKLYVMGHVAKAEDGEREVVLTQKDITYKP